MNIVTAVRRELRAHPEIVGLTRIDKNELASGVQGEGLVATVVSYNGAWRTTMQTAQFPRIGLTIFADATRVDGSVVQDDQYDRAFAAWQAIDKVMHRPTLEDVIWGGDGGVRVLFSNREGEPTEIDHPDPNVAMVRVTYDLKVG